MKISVVHGGQSNFNQDLAVFFVSDDAKEQKGQIERLGGLTGGVATQIWDQKLASAKQNQMFVAPTYGKMSSRLIGMVGLGKYEELSSERIRLIGGTIATHAKTNRAKTLVIDLNPLMTASISAEVAARALTEGLLLGNYEYCEFKTEVVDEPRVVVTSATLIVDSPSHVLPAQSGIDHGVWEAEAAIVTRDLVNQPPAQMHPRTLKETAEKLVKESGGTVTLKTYGRDELKNLGAHAILAVGQGSEHEPLLLHLHYQPQGAKKSVALVGKGVTFDSGGLSIKPSEGMEDMKTDMAGAATVLGIFSALIKQKPDVAVHGICACVENMVSDRSYRIGDVIRTLSGKTVEVLNTDAEGRLILADALYYAAQQQPDVMVDFATLTGAAIVAIGDQITALLSNDRALAGEVLAASAESGEMVWELPLTPEYNEYLKNDTADLQNIDKYHCAGAIMGGLFLQNFVQNVRWAHLDIAGTAFHRRRVNSYLPVGATGAMVRTMLHWLQTL